MPEQKAKLYRHQEVVIGIECHARPGSLLQGCVSVSLVRLSKVNPGRELGARESKAQEAPALPRLFFPAAIERTTKALLRKQQGSAIRAKLKTSTKAEQSLGNQSRFCGLLFLLALA